MSNDLKNALEGMRQSHKKNNLNINTNNPDTPSKKASAFTPRLSEVNTGTMIGQGVVVPSQSVRNTTTKIGFGTKRASLFV